SDAGSLRCPVPVRCPEIRGRPNKETIYFPKYRLYKAPSTGFWKTVMVENLKAVRRPRGRPQIRPDEETRRLIIEAARHEFQTNGYAQASMASVAQKAGISTKTMY